MQCKLVLCACVLMIIPSCTNKKKVEYTLADVPIIIDINTSKHVPMKFENIRYIPLETNSECMIDFPAKILMHDEKIFIGDFFKEKSLFVFDMTGKFLFKIAKMGKGPGEYTSIFDFDIHDNGHIYIFDQWARKCVIYDSRGMHLRDIRFDYAQTSFCLIDDKIYFSELREAGKMIANLTVYDTTTKKTTFLLEEYLHPFGFVSYSFYEFYKSPDVIYYAPNFSEIIFSVSSDGVFPAIGIKNLRIPPMHVLEEVSRRTAPDRFRNFSQNGGYFNRNSFIYETDEYITIKCNRSDYYPQTLMYNKNSKELFDVNLSTGLGVDIGVRGSTGKEFFSAIDIDPERDDGTHLKILQSRKELAGWKEGDNPVIVFFALDM